MKKERNLEAERQAVLRSGKLHWVHWVVISFSLLLTLTAWYFTKKQIDEKIEARFTRESAQTIELISERMRKYEDGLWGGVAAIQAGGGDISYKDWLTFANSLRIDVKYPGVNGIGVIHHVPSWRLDSYLKEQRRNRPDYHLHPEHNENEFWPITYIEPAQTNTSAVGLDVAHESNRYTAARKARDTGVAQITGPITLVQDEDKTPGFLFYAPFFKGGRPETVEARQKNFTGLVYAPFVVKRLMAGTLDKTKRHLGIRISDGQDTLYDEHVASESDFDPDPLFKKTYTIDLYGREWVFEVWSTQSFRTVASNSQPLIILFGGIFIDSLLFSIFILLSRSNKRAINLADQMTRELRARTTDLRRSNAELEQIAYVASHDLRSPLVNIQGFSKELNISCNELTSSLANGHLPEEIRERIAPVLHQDIPQSVEYILANAAKIDSLLTGLLKLSRLGRAELNIRKLDMNEIITKMVETFQIRVSELGAKLEIESLPDCHGDATQINQIFTNLIDNALKYLDPERAGVIRISGFEKEEQSVYCVTDNGIGIPQAQQPKIFEIFHRLNPEDSAGEGLGLTVIQRILKRHNGRISLQSEPGKGSEFLVTLPKEPANIPTLLQVSLSKEGDWSWLQELK